MTNVLGLDISTSCTGIAIIDSDAMMLQYLDSESFKKCDNLWQKTDRMYKRLEELVRQFTVQNVFVEQSLLMFRPGMSSAATIAALTSFNGLVSYAARQVFSVDPVMISAASARKQCGIKVQRAPASVLSAKEQVFQWALSDEGPLKDHPFEKTKTGKFKPYCYDMVDAYVIARAGATTLA